jgi:hypothetical protein
MIYAEKTYGAIYLQKEEDITPVCYYNSISYFLNHHVRAIKKFEETDIERHWCVAIPMTVQHSWT